MLAAVPEALALRAWKQEKHKALREVEVPRANLEIVVEEGRTKADASPVTTKSFIGKEGREVGVATAFFALTRIVDAHTHLSQDPRDELIPYATLNGLRYDLDELLELLESSRISRGLLLSPPIQGGIPLSNERVVELCKKSEGILCPVLTVEPSSERVEQAIALAKQERSLVKAFKIRLGYVRVYADDPVFDRLYAYAESEDLPVMFHTGDTASSAGSLEHSHPLTLDRLANSRAGLKIVACHFGNPWITDAAELVYKHPNVYADTSGLAIGGGKYGEGYAESLVYQLERAIYFVGGADKVLFGTDYPVTKPSVALRLIERLKVDETDREKILGGNAARLFRL